MELFLVLLLIFVWRTSDILLEQPTEMLRDVYKRQVKDNEWELLKNHYETPYFFASRALKETVYMTIELKKVYRQSDTFFISLLNKRCV